MDIYAITQSYSQCSKHNVCLSCKEFSYFFMCVFLFIGLTLLFKSINSEKDKCKQKYLVISQVVKTKQKTLNFIDKT